MNYEGERFLLKLYRELYNEEEVKHSGTKSDDKFELINKYMKRLEKSAKVFDGDHYGLEKYMRERYYDRYVIKEEDIPDSYYELQKRIALERGYGHVEYTPDMKHQEASHIIEEQERSLDKWLDYLMKENTAYPMWARYWAFQGMLKLGMYDKEKNAFTRRSKGTTSPFIELNPEALSYAIETVTLYQNGKEIDDEELKKLVESGNFGKIYSHNLWKIANDAQNKDNNVSLEGKWIKYQKGDTQEVVKALSGKGTGWCIAGESMAGTYLSRGTLEIYYTKDNNGEYTNPRACIRTQNGSIAEVRGINQDQNLEPEMLDIVDRKLDDYPDKDYYKSKANSMKLLTQIYNKVMEHIELTKEEYLFLYGAYGRIEGFGWEEDPRIEETKRMAPIKDKDIAKSLIKKRVMYWYEYADDEIKKDEEIALKVINDFGNNIQYFSQELLTNKDFVLKAVNYNPRILRYISEELKKDRDVILAAVKEDGSIMNDDVDESFYDDKEIVLEAVNSCRSAFLVTKALERQKDDKEVILAAIKKDGELLRYASHRLQGDKELVLEAVRQHGFALNYASEELKDDKEVVLEAVRSYGMALEYASPRLRIDKDVVLEAIKPDTGKIDKFPGYEEAHLEAIKYTSYNLANDRDIIKEMVKQVGYELSKASYSVRDDKEIVLEAVKFHYDCLKYASDRLKNDKDVVLAAVKEDGEAIKYASPELKDDKEVVLAAINRHISAIRYASKRLQNDREFILEIAKQGKCDLEWASENLKNDKEIVLEVVKRNGPDLYFASPELKDDKDVVLTAVKENGQALDSASERLKGDKDVVLAAVKQDGRVLKYADEKLKNDREIVLEAIKDNEGIFKDIDPNLKNDYNFVLEAIKNNPLVLKYTNNEFKNNREIVLEAVKKFPGFLEKVGEKSQDDKEVVLAAVKQEGYALQYASERLQDDKEVVLAAVKQKGYALQYASERLQDDKEVVLAAVKRDGQVLQYASERLQDDKEVVLAAVKQNGYALINASERLKDDEEVGYEAVAEELIAFRKVSRRLKDDKNFILTLLKDERINQEELFNILSYALKNDEDIKALIESKEKGLSK